MTYTVTVEALVEADDENQALEIVLAHGVPCFTDYEVVHIEDFKESKRAEETRE